MLGVRRQAREARGLAVSPVPAASSERSARAPCATSVSARDEPAPSNEPANIWNKDAPGPLKASVSVTSVRDGHSANILMAEAAPEVSRYCSEKAPEPAGVSFESGSTRPGTSALSGSAWEMRSRLAHPSNIP